MTTDIYNNKKFKLLSQEWKNAEMPVIFSKLFPKVFDTIDKKIEMFNKKKKVVSVLDTNTFLSKPVVKGLIGTIGDIQEIYTGMVRILKHINPGVIVSNKPFDDMEALQALFPTPKIIDPKPTDKKKSTTTRKSKSKADTDLPEELQEQYGEQVKFKPASDSFGDYVNPLDRPSPQSPYDTVQIYLGDGPESIYHLIGQVADLKQKIKTTKNVTEGRKLVKERNRLKAILEERISFVDDFSKKYVMPGAMSGPDLKAEQIPLISKVKPTIIKPIQTQKYARITVPSIPIKLTDEPITYLLDNKEIKTTVINIPEGIDTKEMKKVYKYLGDGPQSISNLIELIAELQQKIKTTKNIAEGRQLVKDRNKLKTILEKRISFVDNVSQKYDMSGADKYMNYDVQADYGPESDDETTPKVSKPSTPKVSNPSTPKASPIQKKALQKDPFASIDLQTQERIRKEIQQIYAQHKENQNISKPSSPKVVSKPLPKASPIQKKALEKDPIKMLADEWNEVTLRPLLWQLYPEIIKNIDKKVNEKCEKNEPIIVTMIASFFGKPMITKLLKYITVQQLYDGLFEIVRYDDVDVVKDDIENMYKYLPKNLSNKNQSILLQSKHDKLKGTDDSKKLLKRIIDKKNQKKAVDDNVISKPDTVDDDYSKKTIPQLKLMLKSKNLPVGGNKAELLDRLKQHSTGKGILDSAMDFAKTLYQGRSDYPHDQKKLLEQFGSMTVRHIRIGRTPLPSLLTGALNVVTLGGFSKMLKKSPYDKLYHLFVVLTLDNGKTMLVEKNEAINMVLNPQMPKGTTWFDYNTVPSTLTFQLLMDNTKKEMGNLFFSYDSTKNNCQDFIIALFKSNHLLTQDVMLFVKQDVASLFKNFQNTKGLMGAVTTLGSKVDIIKKGGQLKSPSKSIRMPPKKIYMSGCGLEGNAGIGSGIGCGIGAGIGYESDSEEYESSSDEEGSGLYAGGRGIGAGIAHLHVHVHHPEGGKINWKKVGNTVWKVAKPIVKDVSHKYLPKLGEEAGMALGVAGATLLDQPEMAPMAGQMGAKIGKTLGKSADKKVQGLGIGAGVRKGRFEKGSAEAMEWARKMREARQAKR
jgi:hypothetical protein